MTVWLIDISNHQGTFNVARAVAEGYSGVWMKATEGTTFRDAKFDTFAGQVVASGAVPGAYHYLRSGSGRAQCDAFHARIRDHGGPSGWLAACDNEADASWGTTVDFFARWRELAGDHPLFMYSGNWWWGPRRWDGASLTPYLWDSRYVSGSGSGPGLYSKVPSAWWTSRYGGWGAATVLQFASSGVVAGRSPVDVNAFRGSVVELRALARSRDPVSPSLLGEDDMKLVRWAGSNAVIATNGVVGWWVTTEAELAEVRSAFGCGGVVVVEHRASCGQLVGPRPFEWGSDPVEDTRVAAVAARDIAQQILDRMSGGVVEGVDVVALAAALGPLLPIAPTAAQVADAVVDETAGRLVG